MTEPVTIPEEAVEAAAKSYYEAMMERGDLPWTKVFLGRERYLGRTRAALEAAAPAILAAERERIAQTAESTCNNPYPNTSGQPARRCQKPPGHSGPHQRNGDTWVHHRPFSDDGVTYCGWHVGGGVVYEGCGEVWPCSTERGES